MQVSSQQQSIAIRSQFNQSRQPTTTVKNKASTTKPMGPYPTLQPLLLVQLPTTAVTIASPIPAFPPLVTAQHTHLCRRRRGGIIPTTLAQSFRDLSFVSS